MYLEAQPSPQAQLLLFKNRECQLCVWQLSSERGVGQLRPEVRIKPTICFHVPCELRMWFFCCCPLQVAVRKITATIIICDVKFAYSSHVGICRYVLAGTWCAHSFLSWLTVRYVVRRTVAAKSRWSVKHKSLQPFVADASRSPA